LIGPRCENIPSLSSRIPQDRSKVRALACEIGSVTHAEDPSEDLQEKASTMELGVGTAGNSPHGIVRLTSADVIRLFLRHTPLMRTSVSLYHRHRFPAEIISHCVWLYFRFALSFRDVEEMLAMRGVSLSYETVREWCLKFGQTYGASG
jgi:hypothetical protein